MKRLIRIVTMTAVSGITTASVAHDHPTAHAHGIAAALPHGHGAFESLAVMMLFAGACTLVFVALKQARGARLKRARQAVPVAIIRPGLRLFRDR